jgi:hypothetical protein
MTLELYLHEPLISQLDAGQHHNRGKPVVGEHHSPYGSSRRVKKKISFNSQDLKLIPVHPVPKELSPKIHLHTTNETLGK